MRVLSNFTVGETGIVDKVLGEGGVRRRLLDMGITSGVEITLKGQAPLGDPIQLALRGYVLTVRKAEAEWVVMR